MLGIGWGHCRECTPEEYLKLERELKSERGLKKLEWDELYKEARNAFIDRATKHITKRMKELENEHRNSRNKAK